MKSIFVVGTGRSGTHYTVRLLASFANCCDPLGGEENPDILYPIARAAIHHREMPQEALIYYKVALSQCKGIFLDQHHPNLFFTRTLLNELDDPVFLFPQRPVYQIVSSMLRHPGVLAWYDYARQWRQRSVNRNPYPNQFFGVDRYSEIVELPLHVLCARRVIAHKKVFLRDVNLLNGHLRAVDYAALVDNPYAEFSRVFTSEELATLGTFTLRERAHKESLEKFKENLTEAQVAELIEMEDLALNGAVLA